MKDGCDLAYQYHVQHLIKAFFDFKTGEDSIVVDLKRPASTEQDPNTANKRPCMSRENERYNLQIQIAKTHANLRQQESDLQAKKTKFLADEMRLAFMLNLSRQGLRVEEIKQHLKNY